MLQLGTGMTGRPGHPRDGNEWKKYRVVPRAHPLRTLLYAYFNRSGSKGAFSFPGRREIASVVRWNLHPVIFGVDPRGLLETAAPVLDKILVPNAWVRDIYPVLGCSLAPLQGEHSSSQQPRWMKIDLPF